MTAKFWKITGYWLVFFSNCNNEKFIIINKIDTVLMK